MSPRKSPEQRMQEITVLLNGCDTPEGVAVAIRRLRSHGWAPDAATQMQQAGEVVRRHLWGAFNEIVAEVG